MGPQIRAQLCSVAGRLDMKRHAVGAGARVLGGPPIRIVDHQVTVGAETLVTKQGLDDSEPERQVGNEVTIHDI